MKKEHRIRMIFFEVEAGLCNRLRGLVSAYYFAQEAQQPLTIIWEQDINCNCKFASLFSLHIDEPIQIWEVNCMGSRLQDKIMHRYNRYKKSTIKRKCRNVHIGDLRELEIKQLKEEAQAGDLYLKSNSCWYEVPHAFSILSLKPDIQKKVNKLVNACGENRVGVHIRRTDHEICIENSPTEAFIRAMNKEPMDTCFYVATDDEQELRKIINVFGNEKIVYNAKAELSRGTEQGMEDATIDLFVLSGMKKILGSDGSSFTDIAGMIGEIPVVRCHI